MTENKNRRILLVDDTEGIHEDFKKILVGSASTAGDADLADARNAFFGEATQAKAQASFTVDSARQGTEALQLLDAALQRDEPYTMAFVDVRMPPGWDGVETIEHLWAKDPNLQVVICTAFSDYSGEEIAERLGQSDRLLILKKPFDAIEVSQLAHALTEKWNINAQVRANIKALEEGERAAREQAERLAVANEKAQAANRAKSEFLANMSHEIRTPMTAILGHAEMMRDVSLQEERRQQHIDVISGSGEHLLSILNDLLDLSKVEAGHMRIHIEKVPLLRLIQEVLLLMRTYAAEKGLRLEARLETPVPEHIQSDPVRIRQILLNLVGNAIKFTNTGLIELVLRMVGTKPDERLEIDVVDSGIGVPPEHLSKLFDPFHQVDNSHTRQAGGTGIGLTITKRLAELLHGDIRVESEPGRGSTFTVTVAPGDVTSETRLTRLESGSTRPAATTKQPEPRLRGRILLAEDTPVNQKLISAYLTKAGAEVTVAENGREACQLARGQDGSGARFDLILMDMQMPVMDGYEATRTLRREGYRGPIVALTAHAMPGDREKCLEAGCSDYEVKPVNRIHLLETCRALMQPPAALPGEPRSPSDSSSLPRP